MISHNSKRAVAFTSNRARLLLALLAVGLVSLTTAAPVNAQVLKAGVGRMDITSRTGPVNDPLYARALVIQGNGTTAVIVSLDLVAIAEIGYIKNDFLEKLRAKLK
ncbi:MAG: hypothetical protein VYA62_03765, partial [Planctomycetota bacterium]|nr:hypothetical protein [Planctomycetota bacterium]